MLSKCCGGRCRRNSGIDQHHKYRGFYVVVMRSISASLVFLSVFGKTKLLCDRLIIGEEKVVIVFQRIVFNTRIVQGLEEFGLRPESVRHFSQGGRVVTDTDELVPDGQFIAHRRPRIFNVCHSQGSRSMLAATGAAFPSRHNVCHPDNSTITNVGQTNSDIWHRCSIGYRRPCERCGSTLLCYMSRMFYLI